MPRGAALSHGSSGENITHFVAVRMRVQGFGNLKLTMFSIDDVQSQTLVDFPMTAVTNIQPTRLCNFIQQRASLEIGTTEINEWFRINRIILFSREHGSSYPG